MNRLIKMFALIMFMISTKEASSADEPLWKNVDHWQVRVDTTLNNSCFFYATFARGTMLRIGLDKTATGGGYIIVGNNDWKSIEEGKHYKISIKFDNQTPWIGNATGIKFNANAKISFLYLPFGESEFLEEFMTKNSLEIKYNNASVTTLNLKHNYQVIKELIECQKAMDSARPSSSKDPFAKNKEIQRDPFAR